MIKATVDGPVELYFNAGKKIETTATGAVITGICTATTFSGSGASLTSLPSAQLTGALPAIDGSNLTGIAADKIFEGNTEAEVVDGGSDGHFKVTTEGGERFRINSTGQIITGGNVTPYPTRSATFQPPSGQTNNYISIVAGNTSSTTGLTFGDAAGAAAGNYAGMLAYNHSNEVFTYSQAGNAKFKVDSSGQVLPGADNAQNLGSSTLRWKNIYSADLHCSNKGSKNDVDGTWGDYTIQEGESDLFLINNRSGKKYKFNLTEVN